MSLAPFTIIVAVDSNNGIAKNGSVPWNGKTDMKFFRETTIGKKKNAVIMGRVTYETIPAEYRPLESRRCIIISRTWKQEEHPDILVYPSLGEALAGVGSTLKSYDEVFIAGGEQIYKEAIQDYLYLCRKIYVTKFKSDYGCDQFFPYDAVKNLPSGIDPAKTQDFTRYTFLPDEPHDEYQYLRLLKRIKEEGEARPDRTGVGVTSLFAPSPMVFDIRYRLPILTTKKVFYEIIIKELLFFISGKTDTKILEEQGVKIWKDNTSAEFLKKRDLEWEEGDAGPFYGFQWRHWNSEYSGAKPEEPYEGIDQLTSLIEGIRADPHSRRHILTTWNPSQLDQMVLPPCHVLCQFNVSSDRKWLDCQLYQRSADAFLGLPFNITSYCLLTYMIAHITGLRPRKFVHVIGDAHIYNTHGDQVNIQLRRTPRPFPKLSFREATKLHEIDDFTFNIFIFERYSSWQAINAEMAK